MPCVVTPNLFATSFSCPCSYGFCRDIIFLVVTNIYFSAYQFCRDKKHLGNDRLLFSNSFLLLSYFSRYISICCDIIALPILSSSTISIATNFFSIATEFYHSIAFIVTTKNFFITTQVLPSALDCVATKFSLSPFFWCCSSASCRNREFTSFMFCLSQQK